MSRGSRCFSRYRRSFVLLRDGERCRHCGRSVDVELSFYARSQFAPDNAATIDHVNPFLSGPELHAVDNLVTSCVVCNRKKGRQHIEPAFPPARRTIDTAEVLAYRARHWPGQV